jgi:CheY-like chemotaxis protein
MQEKHGMTVDLQVQDGERPIAEGTSIFLFRSVRELLFNALKHGQTKAAAVRVREEGDSIELVVEDHGVGFDPSTLTDRAGIGLFGIREQLAVRGGRLEVQSAPGQGSTFRLYVPLGIVLPQVQPLDGTPPRRADSGRLQPAAARGAVDTKGSTRSPAIRVLLVDDHPVVRQGLAELLSRHSDIEVIGEADDGQKAVAEALRLNPDVVVMDVSMPRMSGIEATLIICRERPSIRVIGLSIYEAADQAADMKDAGACAFVSKSGPTEAILEAIRSAMAAADPRGTTARQR